ncbi:alpha/beta fold hydrolase [Cupriavidus sp. UME77]|uniref:alpha/beta fold hydrolase n=1 Tax=Cupriavidus sp. UME77 TaxID=1862321 RepID=UPI001601B80E|nr:alpha/beta fold hydrolase [Cupriavidus sp. UME77]MBB1631906.1 hydrolase [Cupriavidus sp. UME77]
MQADCEKAPQAELSVQVQRYDVRRNKEISIEVYAAGAGPVLVLLPSLGRGATDMLELAEPLVDAGYRVLCPQPRGNGRSTGPIENKTLHDWASDIAAVIEHSGQAPVVIVGHAHGNWIARTVASDYPRLVRALVLLAGSAGKVPRGVDAMPIPPEIRAKIEQCGDTSLPDDVRIESLKAVFFAPGNDPTSWLTGWNTDLMTMQTLAQKRTPVDDFFAGGGKPIFNVQAEFDVIAPQRYANVLSEYLGERVKNHTIRNAAHALLPERLGEVADAIIGYLRDRSEVTERGVTPVS